MALYYDLAVHKVTYNTNRLRKKMLFKNLSGWWWNKAYLSGGIAKFVLKRKAIQL
ncbi:hypothetical protein [Flavobacterium sp.]|jgi:hypothetical protein|uniref:hypothetical protein n=1 Tax=Flavobacterium sp. TaxID=239 RepID=UPI0037C0D7ED